MTWKTPHQWAAEQRSTRSHALFAKAVLTMLIQGQRELRRGLAVVGWGIVVFLIVRLIVRGLAGQL